MVFQDEGRTACMDENAALDFVQGRLGEDEVKRIDEHADGCASCRVVIDEAVRAFRERSTGIDRPLAPTVTRFTPGDKLAGRYRILRFIARGGMGEVYEAHDTILSTRIAVKTVAATISDDPLATRRLKQEVNLARRITHPNVCRIFDLGVHEAPGERPGPGVLFITMELVAGVSLAQRVRDDGRLMPEVALPIVQATVAAIGAAHRAGVVHRDLKSDNVMLAPDGAGGTRVVVMDFGLARGTSLSAENSSIEGRWLAGTLAYMAPEQLESKSAGPAADIYALGVVMFEMLTGTLPFRGDPPLPTALKRLSEPAPSVRTLIPDVDPRWEAIVAHCLEREQERRPASVDEVARFLSDDSGSVVVTTLSGSGLSAPSGSGKTPSASDSVRTPGPASPSPSPSPSTSTPSPVPSAAPVSASPSARRTWLPVGALALGLGGLLAVLTVRHRPVPGDTSGTRAIGDTNAAPVVPHPSTAPVLEKPTASAAPVPVTTSVSAPAKVGSGRPGAASPGARRLATRAVSAQRQAPGANSDRSPLTPTSATPTTVPALVGSGEGPARVVQPPRSADPDDGFIFK